VAEPRTVPVSPTVNVLGGGIAVNRRRVVSPEPVIADVHRFRHGRREMKYPSSPPVPSSVSALEPAAARLTVIVSATAPPLDQGGRSPRHDRIQRDRAAGGVVARQRDGSGSRRHGAVDREIADGGDVDARRRRHPPCC